MQRQRAWRETQARRFGFPPSHECCNATAWTWRRAAASYRAQAAFYRPLVAQADEDYFAALYRFRRKEWLDRTDPPQLLAPPVWRLKLGEELRHVPPVLDTCAACRRLTEQVGWAGWSAGVEVGWVGAEGGWIAMNRQWQSVFHVLRTAGLLARRGSLVALPGPCLALASQPNIPAIPLPQLEQEEQRLQAWSVELAEGYRRRALLAAPIATNTCPGSSVALLAAAAELPQTAAQQTAGTAAGRDSEAEVP